MSTIAPPRIVEVIATDAHEGPVYAADEDALYFTTVPRRSSHLDLTLPLVSVRRLALDGLRFPLEPHRLTSLRAPANAANGMTLDREGRLVICEQGSFLEPAAITRMDRRTGAVETVVDAAGGLPLASPNDVVVARDGAIWFTDPGYGFLQGFRPEPAVADVVYRYDPAAPARRRRRAAERAARVRRRHAGHPGGLAVDRTGRVYASAASGIHVFSPGGRCCSAVRTARSRRRSLRPSRSPPSG